MGQGSPEAAAMLSAEGDRTVTWSEFDRTTTALARELLRLGFAKGDFLVTLLPFSVDHVLLEYSCFKIGVIVAPLDLRLSAAEVIRSLEILRPRGFAGLGVKGPLDLRPLWSAVRERCDWIKHFIVMDSEEEIPGTLSFASIAEAARAAEDAGELGEIDCGVSRKRWRAGHLYHRLDRLAQAGPAFAPQHHGAEHVHVRRVFWRRQRHAHAGQSACVARRRPDGGVDEHLLRRRHGGPAGGLRRRPFAARHCPASRGDSGPDSGHVQPGVDAEGLRPPRSLQPANLPPMEDMRSRGLSWTSLPPWRR